MWGCSECATCARKRLREIPFFLDRAGKSLTSAGGGGELAFSSNLKLEREMPSDCSRCRKLSASIVVETNFRDVVACVIPVLMQKERAIAVGIHNASFTDGVVCW